MYVTLKEPYIKKQIDLTFEIMHNDQKYITTKKSIEKLQSLYLII